MLPEKSTLQSLFSEVKALNDIQKKAWKEFEKDARFRGQTMHTWLPIGSAIVATLLCVLSKFLQNPLLLKISLGFLSISYLWYFVILIVLTLRSIWSSRKMFQDPLGNTLDNTIRLAEIHATSLNMFYKYEYEELKYALAYLEVAKASWEKRTNLIVGAIDKLGIVGMISGSIAFFNVTHTVFNSGSPSAWLQSLAYAVPFLYLSGIRAHDAMAKLDTFIILFKMIIETKKSEIS